MELMDCYEKFWDCEDHSCSHYKTCEEFSAAATNNKKEKILGREK